MRDRRGLGWLLLAWLALAALGACELGAPGHRVISEPLTALEDHPPACPPPICPPCPRCDAPDEALPPAGASPTSAPAAAPVDLNTASAQELMTLPGVGPATAEKIIAHRQRRPFRMTRELMRVKGIGPSRFAKLRDRVTVGAP
jgi:competence ComEA-like helix-hairpin-helix protein